MGCLRPDGIKRIWNGEQRCKDQIREAVKRKGFVGGWCFFHDLYGVKRTSDVAIQFGGSDGILQERQVAMRIIKSLRSVGLQVEWSGNLKSKILVDLSKPLVLESQVQRKPFLNLFGWLRKSEQVR
jgi:hypothetical protein